jgi:tetratricopeptide (TPR) repeat protein
MIKLKKTYPLSAFLLLTTALIAAFMPQTAWADYKQAVAYYNQGRYALAIQELKSDLDRNPDWEFGYRLLGLCYLNLKNNALSVDALKKAVQLKSTAFSTYYGLGQAYFNMQKYDNCISILNQGESFVVKEKEADKGNFYNLRASAYFRMNRFAEAVNDLTSALRSGQGDWTDYFMLGVSYFKLDRQDEAIQALEKSLSMKAGQNTAIEFLAKAYLKKGCAALSAKQLVLAVHCLLKAKELDPKNGYIYYNLAEAYLFQKNYMEAEKALNQALNLLPKNPDVLGRMGLIYEKQKKWDMALNAYKKAEEITPSKFYKEAIDRIEELKKR